MSPAWRSLAFRTAVSEDDELATVANTFRRDWLAQIYARLETGAGTEADIDKLLDIADNINGKSFCALGDGAAAPILSSIKFFRDEYVEHLDGGCPFDPHASTLMATEGVGA